MVHRYPDQYMLIARKKGLEDAALIQWVLERLHM
jgi:hypothetical protein